MSPKIMRGMLSIGNYCKHLKLTKLNLYKNVQMSTYTGEEQAVIVEKLNDLNDQTRKILGEKNYKNITAHIQKKGDVKNLEDLLSVPGIGPKTLRVLCSKLLNNLNQDEKKTKNKSPFIFPIIDNFTMDELVSVNVDSKGVSWSKIDTKKKYLLDWKLTELEPQHENTLYSLIKIADKIEEDIPLSDLYVFEEPGIRSNSTSKSVELYHLTCVLSTLMYYKRDSENKSNLVFLKQRTVERHYNGFIGSEKVSLQSFITDMYKERMSMNRSSIFIDSILYNYFKNQEPYYKENLAKSCLLGITFMDKVKNV